MEDGEPGKTFLNSFSSKEDSEEHCFLEDKPHPRKIYHILPSFIVLTSSIQLPGITSQIWHQYTSYCIVSNAFREIKIKTMDFYLMYIWGSNLCNSVNSQAESINVKLYSGHSFTWQKQMQNTLVVYTLKPRHLGSFQIKPLKNEFQIQNYKAWEEIIYSKQYEELRIIFFNCCWVALNNAIILSHSFYGSQTQWGGDNLFLFPWFFVILAGKLKGWLARTTWRLASSVCAVTTKVVDFCRLSGI